MYELAADTIKYYEKEKNGDHFKVENLKKQGVIVAVVADGVSKRPCDWYASQLTCDAFLRHMKAQSFIDMNVAIRSSIKLTNQELNAVEGDCEDLSATLSAIVWNYETGVCWISNIGDSRVYRISDSIVEQLSVDDSIKQKRQVRTALGLRTVDTSQLTNAMGMGAPKLKVQQIEFGPGACLLLASDGFYDARKSSFERDMCKVLAATDFSSAFAECFTDYEYSTGDDMTAVMIKNTP